MKPQIFRTPEDFFAQLKKHPRPVVVDFWASWCKPCQAIAPFIEALKHKYAGKVDVWQVDADQYPELLRAVGTRGIPTLIAYNQGREVNRRVGAEGPDVLEVLFQAALDGKPRLPSLPIGDRLIRLLGAVVLLWLALQNHFGGLYGIGGALGVLLLVSALYDQFPPTRALAARIDEWLRGLGRNE